MDLSAIVAGGVALILVLVARRGVGGKSPSQRKHYVEKTIDALVGNEQITTWKITDQLVQGFCERFKQAGDFVAASSDETEGGIIDMIVAWFLNLIKSGNKHYFTIPPDELKLYGNVLAMGTKPLTGGLVFKMVLVRGTDNSVRRKFVEQTKLAGLQFDVYSPAGNKLTAGLAAGSYFCYSPIDKPASILLPESVAMDLSKAAVARKFWQDQGAVVTPAVLIFSKEALIARVDP